MFNKISRAIRYPDWVRLDQRYKRLDLRDRLLDGTFYDHLPHAFYDEIDQRDPTGKVIPLEERRPSARYELPNMLARWAARKLFAGRHVPRLRHPDKKTEKRISALIVRSNLFQKMMEACVLGSVGSVAATFRTSGTGDAANVAISLWRAKYCQPRITSMGELQTLRVAYLTSGAQLSSMGMPAPADEPRGWEFEEQYWYIRDWLPDGEATYIGVKRDDWNPVEGYKKRNNDGSLKTLQVWNEEMEIHDLGYVTAQWFVNLVGGTAPDGDCTWRAAIPISIDIDYTLSQTGRGVRYNSAPQLVVIGNVAQEVIGENSAGEPVTRSPAHMLQLQAGAKDENGVMFGEGDAKLLEMTGSGADAALKYVEKLRNLALEMIQAARKDPEKMHAPLSGRAMEYLDEDSHDLVMELRTQWGENGMLPLVRKMVHQIMPNIDVSLITCHWPRLYQPTPADIAALIPAFAAAVNPLEVVYNGKAPARPAAGKSGSGATAARGAPARTPAEGPPTPPPQEFMFLTPQEVRAYLLLNLDIPMLDVEGEDADEVLEVEAGIVETRDEAVGSVPVPAEDETVRPNTGGMNVGPPVTVNA